MSLTLNGIEYVESEPGVWVPVAASAPGVTTDPLLTIAHITRFGERVSHPIRLYRGDTPTPVLVAARGIAGGPVSVGDGWTCRTRVVDRLYGETVPERDVSEKTVAGGVTCFVARMTEAESLMMAPRGVAEYDWQIELADAERSFVRTAVVRLAVDGSTAG